MIYDRDYHHKKVRTTKSEFHWKEYRRLRNQTTSCIRKAKKSYFENELKKAKMNSKNMWKILSNVLPSKKQISLISISASSFNDYFSTISTNIINKIDTRFS